MLTHGNDRLAYRLVLEGKLTAQQIADLLKVSISTVYRAIRQVAKELQPPPTDDAKVSVHVMSSGCQMSLVCTAIMQVAGRAPAQDSAKATFLLSSPSVPANI